MLTTCTIPARGGVAGPRPTCRPAPPVRHGRRLGGGAAGPGRPATRLAALPGDAFPPSPPTAGGFHVSRMRAAPAGTPKPPPLAGLVLRVATTDAELAAAAALRAHSFYVYPRDRAFAGRLHQELKTREEYDALVAVRDANAAAAAAGPGGGGALAHAAAAAASRSACLIAVAPLSEFGPPPPPPPPASASSHPDPGDPAYPHPALHLGPDPACGGAPVAVVGTLDVAFARAVAGEDLVGDARAAAYMANVCAAPPARRRGVGAALLAAARGAARRWGVDALYVHALAVNEVAARFYGGAGFVVEKEEAATSARARGHCLDGVEGLGRAVLWRDGRLGEAGVEVVEVGGLV